MILADHNWLQRIAGIACFLIYKLNFERFEREFRLNWATTAFNIRKMQKFK